MADARPEILAAFGATPAMAAEILAYGADGYEQVPLPSDLAFPLADEAFVPDWQSYGAEAAERGFTALADRLVQLNFPIGHGISLTEYYRAVTRRGQPARGLPLATGLVLERLRQQWPLEHPDTPFSFERASQFKSEYQDRFLILSSGWYSGVAPELVGVSPDEWPAVSFVIRREHECAHDWAQRVLSSMKTRVLDEVLADYCGITAAGGAFRADWFLAFYGLEHFPDCRAGGRLANYRGTLSDAAFAVVTRLVHAAAGHLEIFSRMGALSGEWGGLLALLTLSRFTLEELAAPAALRMLARCLREVTLLYAHRRC